MRFPRHELSPVPVYLLLTGGYTFLFTIVISVNLVYQVQEARLNVLQLVLVGTALEATIFLFEVPTGVVADTFSRKRSILLGLILTGAGLALIGVFPRFETIVLAQLIWGIGFTFISGAQEAWIADEVGVENVGPVYLRSAQVEQLARLVAIPLSIAMAALVQLSLPILVGGALFLPLALLLALTMPERGFKPAPAEERASLSPLSSAWPARASTASGSSTSMTTSGSPSSARWSQWSGSASSGWGRPCSASAPSSWCGGESTLRITPLSRTASSRSRRCRSSAWSSLPSRAAS